MLNAKVKDFEKLCNGEQQEISLSKTFDTVILSNSNLQTEFIPN